MKILVLGAGATGGYFGGRLAQAQQSGAADVDVTFLLRQRRADVLAEKGLTVESPQGDCNLAVRTVLHTALEPEYDLVLLSCKAYDLESAILSIYPGLKPETLILPLLNGLAHYDRLDREFGAARILGGCCHIAATLTADGGVRQMTDMQRITFGLRRGQAAQAGAAVARLHSAFKATVVDVRCADNVWQDIWEKFVLLSTLAGMTCLMRSAVGDIMTAGDGESMMRAMLDESESAARHAGFASRPSAFDAAATMLTRKDSAFTASMLRDLESGGQTEGDHIVGDMLRRARAAGNPAPLLAAAWVHLQAREARRTRERKPG